MAKKKGEPKLTIKLEMSEEYVEELNHNPGCAFAWAKVHGATEPPPERPDRGWMWLAGVTVLVVGVLVFVEGRTKRRQTV